MRFVQIKSETAQAAAVVFRARDLLVRQRTQIINPHSPDDALSFGTDGAIQI
jgi:hypothetical protein